MSWEQYSKTFFAAIDNANYDNILDEPWLEEHNAYQQGDQIWLDFATLAKFFHKFLVLN